MSQMSGENERSANVVLTADVDQYRQSIQAASAETTTLTARLSEMSSAMDRLAKSAGTKLQLFGVGSVASIAATSTAYALFEKNMSNLQATAAVTGRSFDAMARNVNNLRREFPTTTAEAAQLVNTVSKMSDGTASVDKLTKTFVKLGAATGESTSGLTQGLLQLQRTMGTSQRDTTKYANSLTVLSQKNGVSAQGILEFSAAIAPMAKAAGMSQEAVQGISTAFLKAGQDGVVAGNAFNKMLADITTSVATGSPDLVKYSNLIGVTADQFKSMFKRGEGAEAMTQIFDELNRQGPQAIAILNRMGFDGVRTVKSLTSMTQQTGGIGKAIADSTAAFQGGNAPGSALNRGSEAALGGLIDNLTKLKNTFAEVGESIGKNFVPPLNALVQVANSVGQTFAKIMDGPLGTFMSWLGGLSGVAAGAAGGLLKLAGPILTAVAGVALLRNHFTGGLQAGMGRTRPGTLGYFSTNAYQQGRMNLIGRGMFAAGTNIGAAGRLGLSAMGWYGRPGQPVPSLGSRLLGAPMWAGAAGLRFLSAGLQPGFHPFDPSRRAVFLPWGSNLRETWGGLRNNANQSASWAARNGIGGWGAVRHPIQYMSQSPSWLARRLTGSYQPTMDRDMRIFRGSIGAGAGVNFRNLATGMVGFTASLARASVGLGALATKSLALGGARMIGSVFSAFGGLPMLAMGGLLAASAMKGQTKGNYGDNEMALMAYSTKVNDATLATADFATAIRQAIDALPKPKNRQEAMTVSGEEDALASSSGYSYKNKQIKTMPEKTFIGQLSGVLARKNTTPEDIQSLMLDAVHRWGAERAQELFQTANRASGNADFSSIFGETFDKYKARAENPLPWFPGKKGMDKYLDSQFKAIDGLLNGRVGIANEMGGPKAAQYTARSDFASVIKAVMPMARYDNQDTPSAPGVPKLMNPGRMNIMEGKRFEEFFNDHFFDGLAEVGSNKAINPIQAMRNAKPGDVAGVIKEIARQVVETKSGEDDQAFARNTGLGNAKALQELVERGATWDSTAPKDGISKAITFDSWAADASKQGLEIIDRFARDMPDSGNFRKRWEGTAVGNLIKGDRIIEKALKPENAENQNIQIRAADELAANMREAGWGTKETARALAEFKGVIGEVNNVLFTLADNAGAIMKQRDSFNANFMNPAGQMAMAADSYFGVVKANIGNNPKAEEERKAAQGDALSAAISGINFIKQSYIQQREFAISVKNSEDDFALSKERNEADYQLMRERAEQNYQISRERAEQNFQISRRRGEAEYQISRARSEQNFTIGMRRFELEYNISRKRAQEEFTISRQHSEIEFSLSQSRMLEDYNTSRMRAQQMFQMSMADAEADFRKSRLRAEQDFNHQVELMVKQSAQNMMNIFNRVSVQRTWSASGLLANARDQNKRMAEQAANLEKLKSMGLSKDAVQQMDLTNPQNAQQVARLVAGLAQDPALIQQWNATIAERLKNAGALVKNDDNAAWEEMQRQYQQQQQRAEEDFQTSVARQRRNFALQMKQQAEDMAKQIARSNADFARQMKWAQDNQTRQMKNAATDHKRQQNQMMADHKRQMNQMAADHKRITAQSLADHKRQMAQAAADQKRVMAQMATDHLTQVNRMITDWNTMMTRMKNQQKRTIEDMTMSAKEIFTKAANLLDGDLAKALKKVETTWGKLEKMIFARSRGARNELLVQWGVKVADLKDSNTGSEGKPSGNSAKPGPQGGGGGGTAGATKAVAPVPGPVGYPYGTKNAEYAKGYHTGNDYPVPSGTPVKAVLPGVVQTSGWGGAYGNYVVLNHGNGLQTLYAHLSKLGVSAKEKVSQGEIIGKTGETGNAHGAHLHFEVRMGGTDVNPAMLGKLAAQSGGGAFALQDAYEWEDLVAKTPFLSHWLRGNVLSKGFNKIVEAWANKHQIDLTAMPFSLNGYTGKGGNPAKNKALGKQMAAAMGWTGAQWDALSTLWDHESGWDHTADNPSSSAYGIPQAMQSIHKLPPGFYDPEQSTGAGTKYFHGAGGDPAVQIKWGLNYIKDRYKTPVGAWSYWQGHQSYGDGAIFDSGMRTINVGERGPEAVFPLNDKGADFMATLLNRFGVADEAKKTHTCGTSVPMSNTVYNYKIDSSSNFHGAITVQSSDPREMAEKLRVAKRRSALTQPGLSRR